MIFNYDDEYGNEFLVNCTANVASGTDVDESTGIVITADSGHAFPALSGNFSLRSSGGVTVQFAIANWFFRRNSNKEVYFKLATGYKWSDITSITLIQDLNASTVVEEQTLTVTANINFNYCSANFQTGTAVKTGSVLTVTANTGYKFSSDIQCRIGSDNIRTFTLNADENIASYTITSTDMTLGTSVIFDNDITAVASSTPTTEDFITVIVSCQFENCTANFTNGETINRGTAGEYDLIKTLTVTANDGYEFNGTFYCELDVEGSQTMTVNNKKTVTFPIYGVTIGYNSTISFSENFIATIAPSVTVSDFVRIFNPTDDELNSLSKASFYTLITNTSVPISNYITALYQIPFDVTGLQLEDKATIILGTYNSNVTATMLDSWILETDGGNITVPKKYENVYDYINTNVSIYIPYFGMANLDPEKVIGHTLTVTYYTNLYEGYTTVDVLSDFSGNKIMTATKKTGFDVPYVQLNSLSALTEINIPTIENTNTAFVEVIRNIPYDNRSVYGKRLVKKCVLSELSGYQVITDITLGSGIADTLQAEIRQILRNGVFI